MSKLHDDLLAAFGTHSLAGIRTVLDGSFDLTQAPRGAPPVNSDGNHAEPLMRLLLAAAGRLMPEFGNVPSRYLHPR